MVIVDDYLPVHMGTKAPVFGKSEDGSLWVALLEKAWAKLYGSYSACQKGTTFFAGPHLYGTPALYEIHRNIED